MRSVAALLAALVMGAVTTNAASAQVTQLEFPRWPAELAPRAPVLSAAIERDFGYRPRWMIYGGQDSLQVLFVNPGLWSSADTSNEIPQESIESAHEAAKHVAQFVWNNFGRDAHLNSLTVRFYRVRRDSYGLPNREVPNGHVEVQFARQDLETGHLENGHLVVSTYGSALQAGQQITRVDLPVAADSLKGDSPAAKAAEAARHAGLVRGPPILHPRGWALIDSIGRAFERPRELAFAGKDTIDVTFWSPAFWLNDMQSKEFPRASLPLVRKAAEQVGGLVWRVYGRDAGINVIRVTFLRMQRVSTSLMTRDVPVQELTGVLTRKQLETGPPQLVALTMAQR